MNTIKIEDYATSCNLQNKAIFVYNNDHKDPYLLVGIIHQNYLRELFS